MILGEGLYGGGVPGQHAAAVEALAQDHVVDLGRVDILHRFADDVILGEGLYGGGVLARHAAITAGLTQVPGLANNRHCAALCTAA
ncbi:hypothetical protein MAHJHV45_48490 [Mycobacterium avium subsp. hominissuis]